MVRHSSTSSNLEHGPVVGVVGSRDFPSLAWVRGWVERLAAKHEHATVVSGGARGVDTTAESAAHLAGLGTVSYRVRKRERGDFVVVRIENDSEPEIVEKGHRSAAEALKSRNTLIVSEADHVVAFHDGKSRGTADAIAKAEQAGKLSKLFTNEELFMREVDQAIREGVLIPVEDLRAA